MIVQEVIERERSLQGNGGKEWNGKWMPCRMRPKSPIPIITPAKLKRDAKCDACVTVSPCTVHGDKAVVVGRGRGRSC